MNKIILAFSMFLTSISVQAEEFPRPEDVKTIDGLMKAYYEVVSVKVGELRQKERDFSIHQPNSPVTTIETNNEGKIVTRNITINDYHINSNIPATTGFLEYEISRKVDRFGATAHVWSTYETREYENGPVTGRGINSIQLYNDGNRWWVVAEMWDNRENVPEIPEEYLPNK